VAGSHDIWVRTFAYDTGTSQAGSRLLPIELITRMPHKAMFFEGCLELRIGGVEILSDALLPCGYVGDWWSEGLEVISSMLSLSSVRWMLPGKQCHVALDVSPGTRVASVQTLWPGHPAISQAAEAHVPSLVDAMLEEAERFFRWLPHRNANEELVRIAAFKTAQAPWRRAT
jgi:hypothetical protein